MRVKGKISSWNDEKGYGFIEPFSGGKRVFIHIKAFDRNSRRPEVNQVVTYALAADKHGRPCAAKATLAGDRLVQKRTKSNGSLSITIAVVFLVFVGVAVSMSKLPAVLLAIYLVASLVTFVAYAMDKAAARKGTWRIQESTLHILSLLGGWPGAIVAQQKLRHKSKKQSFRTVFWMSVVVNCGVLAWMLTPSGGNALRPFLAAVA